MEVENQFAFKEWAVICEALKTCRQVVVVRKGGISEGVQGFRVAHREFWLFPTYLHQDACSLVSDAQPLLDQAIARRPPENRIRLEHYAVVRRVFHFEHESQLKALRGNCLWNDEALWERFNYREPGLFVLVVRVYKISQVLELDDLPHFAGCLSWIEFPEPLSTAGCQPVMTDEEFARREQALVAAVENTVL
jgi:hypothetical protein